VVAIFSSRLLDGEPLTIFGDGEQTRDYTFVGDIVGANMTVSEMELASGPGLDDVAFNVGTGNGVSVNELADALEGVSGVRPGRHHAPPRPGELLHSRLDTARLRGTGWECKWTLEDGLRETFEHIKEGRGTA
jgi:UDP-glucose 4-epimerase